MLGLSRCRMWAARSCAAVLLLGVSGLHAGSPDPAAGDYAGRQGATLYVSKLGDGSDGSSWAKAFHTIQAALLAVPDDQGGHRIVVRPDTYPEANLYPAHKGAAGSYNLLVGDTAAVLVGGSEKSMPEQPHLVMEDCTLVHPDNALGISYASHCARARLTGCRLIVLNFTQPEMGGRSTGIICTERHAPTGRLHVDLADCMLAGHSVFTPGKDAEAVTYTTKGKVQAYVQFRQPVPKGFERLGLWPVTLFDKIAPPKPGAVASGTPTESR